MFVIQSGASRVRLGRHWEMVRKRVDMSLALSLGVSLPSGTLPKNKALMEHRDTETLTDCHGHSLTLEDPLAQSLSILSHSSLECQAGAQHPHATVPSRSPGWLSPGASFALVSAFRAALPLSHARRAGAGSPLPPERQRITSPRARPPPLRCPVRRAAARSRRLVVALSAGERQRRHSQSQS